MIDFTILDNGKVVALAKVGLDAWAEDAVAPEIVELHTELSKYAGTDARSKRLY